VGYNEIADLAVLKVEAQGLVPLALGSSADLLVGDAVVAVGTPASIDYVGTATFGKISATNRLLPLTKEDGSVSHKITVIQTDTSLNPGNSGGPMADMYGRVIGIVVRKILQYGGKTYEGIGFAIPIDGAKVILDAIIKDGSFTGDNPLAEGRSLLGVTGHGGVKDMWYCANADGTITSSETEQPGYYKMPADGVYVMSADGANVQSKLQAGDVILAVNGLRMTTIQDVIAAVNRHYAGETVTVTVLRAGVQLDVEVILLEGEIA
jgi:serine protease Do